MQPLHVIRLKNYPILHQLQLEEALLRADDRNFCLMNLGSPKAIVLGISSKPEMFVHPSAAIDRIPLIKRYSGGGTVVVDEETIFVSFICCADFIPVPLFPEPILRWSADLYRSALNLRDFDLRENDYVIAHRKCGGNAQYIRKNRFVHHTTFLWDYQEENMDYLLHPVKTPKYREGRSHQEFVCRLKPFFPQPELFISDLEKELHKQYRVCSSSIEEFMPILKKDYRRSTKLLI